MKKITKVTLFFVFIAFTVLFVNFYKHIDKTNIPGYDEGFLITDWDKRIKKSEVNQLLVQLSNKYNYDFIRVNSSYKDQGNTRYIIEYNDKTENRFNSTPFERGMQYKHLDKNSDVLNRLTFVGAMFYSNDSVSHNFEKDMNDKGLKIEYVDTPIFSIFWNFVGIHHLMPIMIILIIIMFTALLYNQIISIKDYAVKRLHGYSTLKILKLEFLNLTRIYLFQFFIVIILLTIGLYIYNQWAQIKELFFLFAIFNLGYYCLILILTVVGFMLINSESFKIQKYLKRASFGHLFQYIPNLLKIIITLTLLSVISTSVYNYKQLKVNLESKDDWEKNRDLYMAEIAPNENISFKKNSEFENKIKTFLNHVPNDNKLFSFNYKYDWNKNGENYTFNNFLFINDTYLKRNKVEFKNLKKIDTSKITMLIPEKVFNEKVKKNVKNEMIDYLKEIYTTTEELDYIQSYLDIDILEVKNNYKLFNYNGISELDKSYSYNPIIVYMPDKLVIPMFHSAALTQGLLLFNDYDAIQNIIEKNHIDDEIQGLTNIYTVVLKEIQQLETNLILSVITSIFGLIVLVGVFIFVISMYCDSQMYNLFVKKLHGISFIKRHGKFIIESLLSTFIAVVLSMWLNVISFSSILILLTLILELIAMLLIINKFENRMLKEIRKCENEQ